MLDIHSHILPGIDDGAKTKEDSRELLIQLSKQGVTTVACTPHFYPDSMDLEDFIALRTKSYQEISEFVQEAGNIKVLLGAEVLYFSGMGKVEDIKKLTVSGSKYLLLELLGLKKIDDKVIKDIVNIKEDLGIMPVIAHVERYCRYRGYKELVSAIKEGYALCQVNATFTFSKAETKAVKNLIKAGLVNFVASDCHDPVKRPVYIESAISAIKTISKEQCERIIENTQTIERELLAVYDKQHG